MDRIEHPGLRAEARRRYEKGCLLLALSRSAPLLAVVPVILLLARSRSLAAASALLLLATSVLFLFQGRAYGRALLPGLLAGAIPFGLCALASRAGVVCTAQVCVQLCLASCISGGLIAGFLVGRRAAKLPSGRLGFLASAGWVTVVVATPVCAIAGASGVLGMLFGLAVGTAPGLLLAPRPA